MTFGRHLIKLEVKKCKKKLTKFWMKFDEIKKKKFNNFKIIEGISKYWRNFEKT